MSRRQFSNEYPKIKQNKKYLIWTWHSPSMNIPSRNKNELGEKILARGTFI